MSKRVRFEAGEYEFEISTTDNKVSVSCSKPYTSTYSFVFKIRADKARQLARWLNHFADTLDSE